ncbi:MULTISPECIES: hypothetical protein [Methylosinus]|uniref:TubC N-terminal docking domain-containing protein n=1 Tax=Methylosinus trichosporium (strain ATCC 35070 / NCIMB 11131 / UNIQEM 75 / OB3b) TaxID=595536 RepID=A0A2D2CYU5_METT3|nr:MULTISPECIES: hypothetical protein [Methylosinus]ATQ67912.1 hypothetical protein CQW49_08450 [Methylosinus trichosporium OB3b]OBS54013.1 hypothetical protein A8B73_02865 [Methylosinus sp. 3S-1]
MSDLAALIVALAEEGATLRLSDNGAGLRLELRDDAPDLPAELLAAVKARKPEIIAHLRAAAGRPAEPIGDAPVVESITAEPPPIFVTIAGKRQLLEPATITIGKQTAPERPQAVHVADVEPSDLTDDERARFDRARERRAGMSHGDAVLFEAKLAFNDPIAWAEFYRNAR